ncbi:hypothetical protein CK203_005503 [Vitis vinifera]|uniref:Uncharacterized protein n=1 Tax=Vitis vinifera TaxID=29760 RepID=A0A438K3R9_VITVI|nr:hypothetical protein CK203_005503 [Vitis vinifera]
MAVEEVTWLEDWSSSSLAIFSNCLDMPIVGVKETGVHSEIQGITSGREGSCKEEDVEGVSEEFKGGRFLEWGVVGAKGASGGMPMDIGAHLKERKGGFLGRLLFSLFDITWILFAIVKEILLVWDDSFMRRRLIWSPALLCILWTACPSNCTKLPDRWIPRPVRKISCMDRDDGRMEFHRGSNCSRFSSQHNYWREQVGRPTEAIDCVKQSMLVTTPVDACVQEESSAPGFGGSATNGTNTRKRKSRWDQPIEAHPDPRFHPHKEQKVQPNLLQSFGSIPQPGISEMVLDHTNGISRMDKDCPGFVHNHPQQDQAEEEEDERQNLHEDVPPGFAYPLNTPLFSSNASSASADLAQQTVSHSNSTFEVAGASTEEIQFLLACFLWNSIVHCSTVWDSPGRNYAKLGCCSRHAFPSFSTIAPYPRDRRDPPSQTVNPITRNQPGEEQQNCHGSASCHTDQSTPSTSGASPPDVNVPCANNQHVFKRVKNNSYDLGRKYFRQQKWNNSKVRSPWHRKWNSWGFMANNARNGVCSIGIGNLANEPKGPYCSEDVSNRVENAGNTSYQHPQHQNQH